MPSTSQCKKVPRAVLHSQLQWEGVALLVDGTQQVGVLQRDAVPLLHVLLHGLQVPALGAGGIIESHFPYQYASYAALDCMMHACRLTAEAL